VHAGIDVGKPLAGDRVSLKNTLHAVTGASV